MEEIIITQKHQNCPNGGDQNLNLEVAKFVCFASSFATYWSSLIWTGANIRNYACCSCCSAYLSSCHRTASDAKLLDDPHTFHYHDYFVIGGIRTCLGVSDDPMFVWISSNSCPLNLLLVRSHQAETIVVKRLIQGRINMTRVRVKPRPHLLRVVLKTTPLLFRPRCRLIWTSLIWTGATILIPYVKCGCC